MTTIQPVQPSLVRALAGEQHVKILSWGGNDVAGEVEYRDGKTLHFRVWKQGSHSLKEYAIQRSAGIEEQAWRLAKRAAWLALERNGR